MKVACKLVSIFFSFQEDFSSTVHLLGIILLKNKWKNEKHCLLIAFEMFLNIQQIC